MHLDNQTQQREGDIKPRREAIGQCNWRTSQVLREIMIDSTRVHLEQELGQGGGSMTPSEKNSHEQWLTFILDS